jgi:hypothetical protein
MCDHLVKIEASTDLFGNADVREAITDKAIEHVEARRWKGLSTRFQRVATAIATQAKRLLLDGPLGASIADAVIVEGGDALAEAHEAIRGSENPYERKLMQMEAEEEEGS